MDNKAQVSIEYIIIVAVGLILAAVVVLLSTNLLGMKEGIKETIRAYRDRVFQLK